MVSGKSVARMFVTAPVRRDRRALISHGFLELSVDMSHLCHIENRGKISGYGKAQTNGHLPPGRNEKESAETAAEKGVHPKLMGSSNRAQTLNRGIWKTA